MVLDESRLKGLLIATVRSFFFNNFLTLGPDLALLSLGMDRMIDLISSWEKKGFPAMIGTQAGTQPMTNQEWMALLWTCG